MNRLCAILVAMLLAGPVRGAERPNFVFILVDDLGVMDLGAYNPETFYETPHVDQLARSSKLFTDGYAANPVCSPTRFSIMTGKYPSRFDATNWFSGVREGRFRPGPLNDWMPLEELTPAEVLKEAGYRTAFVGKWHLGRTEEYWPEAQGFDINIGGHHRGSPPGGYFAPYDNPRLSSGPEGEYLTERLTDESIKILEEFQEDPFFLYLCFYTVHTPLQAPKELVEKYRAKAERLGLTDQPEFSDEEQVWPTDDPRKVRILQAHPTYAAMVEMMDRSVGRLLEKLDELGLNDDTVVMFMSDNGGLSTSEGSPTSNLPFRGGKGWLYEGGIREPFLIRWPGVTDAGGSCSVPVTSTDFYPTMLDIAGVDLKPEQHLDGRSLAPLLKGEAAIDRDALFWHYPHYSNQGGFPGGAVRQGDLKLIERFEDGRVHLYDLAEDPGEQMDLADKRPEDVKALREQLHAWYNEVDAKFLQAKEGGPEPWRPD